MNCIYCLNKIEHIENFELKNFNTLKIQSTAKVAYFPANEQQMCLLLANLENPFILGAGSNVLLSSNCVKNPVILTKKMSDMSVFCDTIEVQAGAATQKLSKFALDNSLSGFEFLIGIPATLGGAVVMNAGAHGQCIADTIVSARVYDKEENKIVTLEKNDLNLSYRNSLIKENPKRYVVLSANFKLNKASKDVIEEKMRENTEFRKRVQPNLSLPNAGSVFKNPTLNNNEKLSAGMLIDKCGLRAYSYGGAKVWENHANFVINYNNCTSDDYTNVVYKMYDSVIKKFNIELEPEIIFAGEMSQFEEEKWKIMKKH